MSAKKILMLVGDYAEDYEVMVPFQALQMVGTPGRRRLPGQESRRLLPHRDPRLRGRPDLFREARAQLHPQRHLRRGRCRGLRRLVIPGGRAPEYLRLNEQRARHRPPLRRGRQADRRHLPRRPDPRRGRRVRGRTVSAYPACAPEVKVAGGRFADIAVDEAVTDGNLVTAPAWPAHPKWLAQFLVLLDRDVARAA